MSIKTRLERLEETIGHSNKIPRKDSLKLISINKNTTQEEKRKLVAEEEKKLHDKYGVDADLSDVVFLFSFLPDPERPPEGL
jgi:hypothetical protein